MDYEAIDREMSCWIVATTKNGIQFYLTKEGHATDRTSRAYRYRYEDQAINAAENACSEYVWRGFAWKPMHVAEMIATQGATHG